MMPRISIPALILAITAFPVSADDMMTGLAAYDAGDYRVAVAHWRAASEAGEIGNSLDRADRLHAEHNSRNALEYSRTGTTSFWRNPDSGYSGILGKALS